MILSNQKQRVIWLCVLAGAILIIGNWIASDQNMPSWVSAIIRLYDILVGALFTAILINYIASYRNNISNSEKVKHLSEENGYDHVLHIASELWQEKALNEGRPGEGRVIGPHKERTVSCNCNQQASCNWCGGSGWLTTHVSDIKNQEPST